MPIILNIDVSGQQGLVALSRENICIDSIVNNEPMQHAAFLQPAIQTILMRNGIVINQLDAVALCNGPGSYTGLRVGLASAKGLCFALEIPLITINTLQVLARAAADFSSSNSKNFTNKFNNKPNASLATGNHQFAGMAIESNLPVLFCPMIDARRMEVFFGVYNQETNIIIEPAACVIDHNFLHEYLAKNRIYFFGSGAAKWQTIANSPHAIFLPQLSLKDALCQLAIKNYNTADFADLNRSEPFYCKAFYTSKHV